LVLGNRLLVPLREGPLLAFDATTLAALYRIPGDRKGRPLVTGGRLWVVDAQHRVHVFERIR
ncbi:MAG: hypothetical protein WBO45_26565, partial [Planctomycetota bacterium]